MKQAKGSRKGSIITGIVIFLIALFICVAMCYTPAHKTVYTLQGEEKRVLTLGVDEVIGVNDCTLDSNGEVQITGEDPYLVFGNLSYTNLESVEISLKEASILGKIQVFVDAGDGFVEEESITVFSVDENDSVVVPVEARKVRALRIDIEKNCTLTGISLTGTTVVETEQSVGVSKYLIVESLIISAAAAAAAILLERKFGCFGAVIHFLNERKKSLAFGILFTVCCGAAACLTEFVTAVILSDAFCVQRAILFGAAFLTVLFLIRCRKYLAKDVEKIFAGVVLIIGTAMIFVTPVKHVSWDMDSHYRLVVESSFLGNTYLSEADDKIIHGDPDYTDSTDPSVEPSLENTENVEEELNESYEVLERVEEPDMSVAHLLSGVFTACLRLLQASFSSIYTLAKFANLLLYTVVCHFAIRKLKSGKMILSLIALLPINLFLTTNYNYDSWVTAFSLFGVAWFVGECQDRGSLITTQNTILMQGAIALACIPKQIYFPMLLLPFFMPRKKIGNKKKYYLICVLIILLLGISLLLRMRGEIGGAGDSRGGGGIDPMGQLSFILGQPGSYAAILLNFFKEFLNPRFIILNFTLFGYLGVGWGSTLLGAALLVVTITDKEEIDRHAINGATRIFAFLQWILCAVLITTSLYLVFNPVGSETISGVQGRYLIPLIYPIAATVWPGFGLLRLNRWKAVYNLVVIAIPLVVTLVALFTMLLPFYL